jgi:hypothetical protein
VVESTPVDREGTSQGIMQRISHFVGTSPDDAHNRRRLIFFLICCCLLAIGFELYREDDKMVDLIKDFTSTLVWLIGIYVTGTVASQAVNKAS